MSCCDPLDQIVAAARGDPAPFRRMGQLVRLIARHGPVTTAQVAAAFRSTEAEAAEIVAALPYDVERDVRQEIIGAGLTLRQTEHKLVIENRTFYVWCALDALMFPVLLEKQALVTSKCSATGMTIRMLVAPNGVRDLQPPEAVVSLVPLAQNDLRSVFCARVRFFASTEAASSSSSDDTAHLPVVSAFDLAQRLVAEFFSPPDDAGFERAG